jgi:hypothetical protein
MSPRSFPIQKTSATLTARCGRRKQSYVLGTTPLTPSENASRGSGNYDSPWHGCTGIGRFLTDVHASVKRAYMPRMNDERFAIYELPFDLPIDQRGARKLRINANPFGQVVTAGDH